MPDEIVVTGSRRFTCAWGSGSACLFNPGGAVEPEFFFPIGNQPDPADPPGEGVPPIGPGPDQELTVTATPSPVPAPFGGPLVLSTSSYGGFMAVPAPAPRRRAPRRRPPPKKPARRSRPRKPAPPVRIPKVLKKIASTVAKLGRAGNFLLGVIWPEDLGGGEQEFLDNYYGVFHDESDSNDSRAARPVPNIGGLPNYGGDIGGLLVTGTRPRDEAQPLSFVSPFGNPLSTAPALFGAPRDYPAVAPDQAQPRPTPGRQPRPVSPPVVIPYATPEPVPFAEPAPRSGPAPRVVRPPLPVPFTPLQPGVISLPLPQPTPVEATNECDCPGGKKKKKKKRDPRTECKTGTYTQTAKSIIYKPKRKVPCQ